MSNTSQQTRFSGDEEKAATYLRPAQQEMAKLREMKRTSKVPVLQRVIPLDDNTEVLVQIAGEQEFIHITHNPPESPFAESPPEEEPLEVPHCPPNFVVYKNDPSTSSDPLEVSGHVFALDTEADTWRRAEVPGFEGCAGSGWYGLPEAAGTLNAPGAHRSCDVITWHGNPNTVCDNGIFTKAYSGAPTYRYVWNLRPKFYYQGKEQLTPAFVVGACLLPYQGQDYYYILAVVTGDSRSSGVDPRFGGCDERIYRKLYGAESHAEDGWELTGTIPYTSYSSWPTAVSEDPSSDNAWPVIQGTAYIDPQGIAWFTKIIYSNEGWPERSQMRVDLRSGYHTRVEGTERISFWAALSGDDNVNGNYESNACDFPQPAPQDRWSQGSGGASGEQYIYTMGGLEARYDVFVKVVHGVEGVGTYSESWSAVNIGNAGEACPAASYEWQRENSDTVTVTQDSRVTLIIRKDGRDIWQGPIMETTVNISRTDGVQTGDIPTVTEYRYMFLHPHALEHTTYMKRVILWSRTDGVNTQVDLSMERGDPNSSNADVFLQTSDTNPFVQGQFNADPWLTPTVNQLASGGGEVLTSGTCNIWGFATWLDGALTPTITSHETAFPGVTCGISLVSGNKPIHFGAGQIGMEHRPEPYSGTIQEAPVRGYGHSSIWKNADTNGRLMHKPAYIAIQRYADAPSGIAYILCLQDILDGARGAFVFALDEFVTSNNLFNSTRQYFTARLFLEDTGHDTGWAVVQSNAWKTWRTGVSYVVDQATRYQSSDELVSAPLWRCTVAHTSTVDNYPGSGVGNWERVDPKITFFSNVMSEAQLLELTQEFYADIYEVGVI